MVISQRLVAQSAQLFDIGVGHQKPQQARRARVFDEAFALADGPVFGVPMIEIQTVFDIAHLTIPEIGVAAHGVQVFEIAGRFKG